MKLTTTFLAVSMFGVSACESKPSAQSSAAPRSDDGGESAHATSSASAPSSASASSGSGDTPPQKPTFADVSQPGCAYAATPSGVFVIDPDGATDRVLSANKVELLEAEPDGRVYVVTDQGLSRIAGSQVELITSSVPAGIKHLAAAGGKELWALTSDAVKRFDGSSFHDVPITLASGATHPSLLDVAVDAQGGVWVAGGAQGLFEWSAGQMKRRDGVDGAALRVQPDRYQGVRVLTSRALVTVRGAEVKRERELDGSTTVAKTGALAFGGAWAVLQTGGAADTEAFVTGQSASQSWVAERTALAAGATWFTIDEGGRLWLATPDGLVVAHSATTSNKISKASSIDGGFIAVEVVGKGPRSLPAEISERVSTANDRVLNPSASTSGAAQVDPPKPGAAIGGASVSGGSVGNASAVVAGMAAGFRRCYNKGLVEDPNAKGTLRVTAKIGPNGEVLSATAAGGGGLPEIVKTCVTMRVSSAQFDKPVGGAATIVIPVSFAPM